MVAFHDPTCGPDYLAAMDLDSVGLCEFAADTAKRVGMPEELVRLIHHAAMTPFGPDLNSIMAAIQPGADLRHVWLEELLYRIELLAPATCPQTFHQDRKDLTELIQRLIDGRIVQKRTWKNLAFRIAQQSMVTLPFVLICHWGQTRDAKLVPMIFSTLETLADRVPCEDDLADSLILRLQRAPSAFQQSGKRAIVLHRPTRPGLT